MLIKQSGKFAQILSNKYAQYLYINYTNFKLLQNLTIGNLIIFTVI